MSVIMPVLNEAALIEQSLECLQDLRRRGHEVILADGGSEDETLVRAQTLVDRVIVTPPGRGVQMHAAAQHARGDVLWFLHADTRVPNDADRMILDALKQAPLEPLQWGRFDVCLSGGRFALRVIERFMNLRSRLSGIATGDQGIFVTREIYASCGGLPAIPLMEDIELCRRLKALRAPHCLNQRLVTSSRRWEENGIMKTVGLMWLLRAAYALGVPARRLAGLYA